MAGVTVDVLTEFALMLAAVGGVLELLLRQPLIVASITTSLRGRIAVGPDSAKGEWLLMVRDLTR